ncbi:hypothetical protein Ciccas_010375, partial [Cichlidogyrus casuarinus]
MLALEQFVDIFGSVSKAIRILERDGASSGYILPVLAVIQKNLRSISDRSDLTRTLLGFFESRFKDIFKCQDLAIATLLHPKFKMEGFENYPNSERIVA